MSSIPDSERRGLPNQDLSIATWEAVLFRGELQCVSSLLEGLDDVSKVRADVTTDLLNGELNRPGVRHLLLIQLVDSDWVSVVGLNPLDDEFSQSAAAATGLELAVVGYQDTAGVAYFDRYTGGKQVVKYRSDCDHEHHREATFKHPSHRKMWLQKFDDRDAVLHELLAELDAYTPLFFTINEGLYLTLGAFDDDVLNATSIKQVDLVEFAPAGLASEHVPQPHPSANSEAGERLGKALKERKPRAVRKAIADRADIHYLPGTAKSPLFIAIDGIRGGDAAGFECAIVLLKAGANPNFGGKDLLKALRCKLGRFDIELISSTPSVKPLKGRTRVYEPRRPRRDMVIGHIACCPCLRRPICVIRYDVEPFLAEQVVIQR